MKLMMNIEKKGLRISVSAIDIMFEMYYITQNF